MTTDSWVSRLPTFRQEMTLPSGEFACVTARFGTVTITRGDVSISCNTDDEIDNYVAPAVMRDAINKARDVMAEARNTYARERGRRRTGISAQDRGVLDRIARGLRLPKFEERKIPRYEALGLIERTDNGPVLTAWGRQEIT